jgi:hypothetical protein
VEAADPPPQDTAWDGNCDDHREKEARRSQVIAKCDEVGDEIGREDRLDAIEGEAGE